MNIVTFARFVATPHAWGNEDAQNIEQAAEVEIDGIRLFSKTPSSAAEAAKINAELNLACGN